MTRHWDFNKESDLSFGVFYPKHFIIIGLDDEARAVEVAQILLAEGFKGEEIAFASGSFVTDRLESVGYSTLLDRVKRTIAHIAGTEQGFIDDDLKLARRGGAFVFVYPSDDAGVDRASLLIRRIHPVYARRYLPLAIDRIVDPNPPER